jgi:hypothetical protein
MSLRVSSLSRETVLKFPEFNIKSFLSSFHLDQMPEYGTPSERTIADIVLKIVSIYCFLEVASTIVLMHIAILS